MGRPGSQGPPGIDGNDGLRGMKGIYAKLHPLTILPNSPDFVGSLPIQDRKPNAEGYSCEQKFFFYFLDT